MRRYWEEKGSWYRDVKWINKNMMIYHISKQTKSRCCRWLASYFWKRKSSTSVTVTCPYYSPALTSDTWLTLSHVHLHHWLYAPLMQIHSSHLNGRHFGSKYEWSWVRTTGAGYANIMFPCGNRTKPVWGTLQVLDGIILLAGIAKQRHL